MPEKKSSIKKTASAKKKSAAKKSSSSKKSKASSKKTSSAKRYGHAAQNAVEKEMHEYKRGRAHSGKAKKPVKSRKQAIAIALSKARKQGAKVPKKAAA